MTRKRAHGIQSEAALFMLKGGSLTQCLPGLSELSKKGISICHTCLRSRSSVELIERARVLLSDYLIVCCSTSHSSLLTSPLLPLLSSPSLLHIFIELSLTASTTSTPRFKLTSPLSSVSDRSTFAFKSFPTTSFHNVCWTSRWRCPFNQNRARGLSQRKCIATLLIQPH